MIESIPNSCNNFNDLGIYTNRGIMDIYNESRFITLEIQKNILIEYVSSERIITESIKEKIADIGKKIKEILENVWEKIKKFFDKIKDFLSKLFKKTKEEIFTKATKKDFDESVEYFSKKYNGKEIEFTTKKVLPDGTNVFFSTENFIKSVDRFNNDIFTRAKFQFDRLSNDFNMASKSSKHGPWLGKQISNKNKSIEELKSYSKKRIVNFILKQEFKESDEDSLNKDKIEEIIYKEIPYENSFVEVSITSSNLNKYADQISKSVYSNNNTIWTGITANDYNELNRMIKEAIKNVDKFTSYSDKYNDKAMDEFDNNIEGPQYAIDYVNRCKDISMILVSIISVMNNIINKFYQSNIRLIISIINNYWRLTKQNRKISVPEGINIVVV